MSTESKEKARESVEQYIKENTKTLSPYDWKQIYDHVNNLIEYYSYISSKRDSLALRARIMRLLQARDFMLAEHVESGKEKVMLTKLDLIFLEFHLKEEIAAKIHDKSLINTDDYEIPGEIIIEE